MPSSGPTRYYWDSCVYLSAIDGDRDRLPVIEEMLSECEAGKYEIFTSHLSISEVCFAKAEKSGRVLDAAMEEKIDKLWDENSPTKLVEVHELVTQDARALVGYSISKGLSLKPPDAIHLATARIWQVSEFYTYDAKLFKYAGIMGFKIGHPHVEQMPLFPRADSPLCVLRTSQWHWRKPRMVKVRRPPKSAYRPRASASLILGVGQLNDPTPPPG